MSLLENMENVEKAAAVRKLRHNGTDCFAELQVNGIATGFWVRVYSLSKLCRSISIVNRQPVLRTFRHSVLTRLARQEYTIDFPQFPFLIKQFAISTLNGIYMADSDIFVPYKYPSEKRMPFALQLCYAMGKRNMPVDVLQHILNFIVPTHTPPPLATIQFLTVNWTCLPAPYKPSIELLPDFKDNLDAHTPYVARSLEEVNALPMGLDETCARLGEMIKRGSRSKTRIVVSDPLVFKQSSLYGLLRSIMRHRFKVVQHGTVSVTKNDVHFLGTPSKRRETRVMDVIRLCIRSFKKRQNTQNTRRLRNRYL